MNSENLDASKCHDYASLQVALKLALARAIQLEAWEKTALAQLSQANIKNALIHEEHHQTFLNLRRCLEHTNTIQALLDATILAHDRDIFWRLANPVRKSIAYLPKPVVVYGRKFFKLSYWLLTPWKMKARFQYIKAKNNLSTKSAITQIQNNSHVKQEHTTLNDSSQDLYEKIKAVMNDSRTV